MNDVYLNYLFNKNIFVGRKSDAETAFSVAFMLSEKFGVKVSVGAELLTLDAVRLCESRIGVSVSEAFYRGFPQSVRELSRKKKQYDAFISYFITYGLGDFSDAQHSYYEEVIDKVKFSEGYESKVFTVMTESDATAFVKGLYKDLLSGTRPLSIEQKKFLCCCVKDFGFDGGCSSRNTKIVILANLKKTKYAKHIKLSDVPVLVEELLHNEKYWLKRAPKGKKCLRLDSGDRRFVAKTIDEIFEKGEVDVRDCYEKQANWCGILHQIHYIPKRNEAKQFVSGIRSGKNISVYSQFEKQMGENAVTAARTLLKCKGASAVLRNLDYVLSRCESEAEIQEVLTLIGTKNGMILAQLILKYGAPREKMRTFVFIKNNNVKTYVENGADAAKSRTALSEDLRNKILAVLKENFAKILKNKLGKVYVSEEMKNIALPISESASMSGFNVLPKGSKIPLAEGKVIRLFTYWEKMDDIDLSCSGMTANGEHIEFSWRTMCEKNTQSILFSGDQTSGYNGGSEYFDIDFELLKKEYPSIKYIVVSNNAFSGIPFSKCICTAGFMFRENVSSGETYEPKTVKTAFAINSESIFCHLFAIDVDNRTVIWLNVSNNAFHLVAEEGNLDFSKRYFYVTDTLNYYDFFKACATEVVSSPEEADVVVTYKGFSPKENQSLITSLNVEKVAAYLNGAFG